MSALPTATRWMTLGLALAACMALGRAGLAGDEGVSKQEAGLAGDGQIPIYYNAHESEGDQSLTEQSKHPLLAGARRSHPLPGQHTRSASW